jgi:hypothetical protein
MKINFPSKISLWLWNENFYENRLGTNFVWILIGFLVAKSVTARKEHYDILLSMGSLWTKGSDMNMKRGFVLYCNSFFLLLDFGLSQLTTSLQFIMYHVAGFCKPNISTWNNARLEFSAIFVPSYDPNEWCLKKWSP